MDRESPGNKIKQYRQFPTTKVKNCKKDNLLTNFYSAFPLKKEMNKLMV